MWLEVWSSSKIRNAERGICNFEEKVAAIRCWCSFEPIALLLFSFLKPRREKRRILYLESTSSPEVDSQINVAKGDGVLTFTKGKETKPFLQYQMEPGLVPAGTDEKFKHGAHLHPFFTPAGTFVAGNHPSDHPHQRGIWMSWTKTNFEGRHPDYWNMGKDASGNLTGEILFKRLTNTWSGPVRAGFTSVHDWIDHTSGAPKPVLEESWSVSLSSAECAGKPVYLMDFTSDQKCAGSEPLKLPEYHYGGLGVRGPAEWDPVEAVTMSTSEGLDRAKGDGSKAKWVVMKGGKGKTEAGLCGAHPS